MFCIFGCTQCREYHLCQKCFDSHCHPSHSFTFREKRNERWKSLKKNQNKMPHFQEKQGQVYTPKHVIKSLPHLAITKNSELLAPGYQCRRCLKAFGLGQYIILLPCSYKFHKKSMDSWLFHKSNSCPIDGQVIYNLLVWNEKAVNRHGHHSFYNTDITHLSKQEESKLFIPGNGLVLKQKRLGILSSIPQRNSEKLNTPQSSTDTYQTIMDYLNYIKLDDPDSRKLIYEYKISQHFPRYLQDLPTGSLGKISQIYFSFIAQQIIYPTAMKRPCTTEKYHTGRQMAKDYQHINHNLKKILVLKERKTGKQLLSEDLIFIVNWGTTNLSLSKRYDNSMGKIRQKCHHLSSRPIAHPLNTKSPELSLIPEGVQL
ncbi:LOW QUALITY PROTEIN: E3 ubiquitin-protein ligase ZSWIM2 [Rhynchonycteris naso]